MSMSQLPPRPVFVRHPLWNPEQLSMGETKLVSEDVSPQPWSISIARWLQSTKPRLSGKPARGRHCNAPLTTISRAIESLADTPLDLFVLARHVSENPAAAQETVLYLGYGSNMSAETFRGRRGVRPLSQVNVVVPELALTFDLPGIPYSEPCFGNTRYRNVPTAEPSEKSSISATRTEYHKDRWHKGLVGIVYEVTKADYVHIIATEGGGSAYQDVLVDCYALSNDPTEQVPATPKGFSFKAHTLFSPDNGFRHDASYAQPSARYLKLITDGAREHDLPHEYQTFLKSIGTYQMTTSKQRLGQYVFVAMWAPIFAIIFGSRKMFLDKNGRYPPWFARFSMSIFLAVWESYDHFFKRIFGDGERTMEIGGDEPDDTSALLKGQTLPLYNGMVSL